MLRSLVVAIFPAAMLASGLIANAQTTVAWNGVASSGSWVGPRIHQSSTPQQNTKRPSNFGTTQHNVAHHSRIHRRHHHHRNANAPWWSRSVYINAGSADQYLASPTPTPKPNSKNEVTQPGVQIFKTIGN
jgi:hypothetical protein